MSHQRAMKNMVRWGMIATIFHLGCGGTQEEAQSAYHESTEPTTTASLASIEVPNAVVQAMKTCVETTTFSFSGGSQAFQYDVRANTQGKVSEVKRRDSTLRDPSLEECFERALAAMDVPTEALRLRISKPFSGGENKSWTRGNVGVVQAIAAPVALAPIALAAAGVVILVAVAVHVIDDTTAERERCKQVKQGCIEYCSDTVLDQGFHEPHFSRCMRTCMEQANCW